MENTENSKAATAKTSSGMPFKLLIGGVVFGVVYFFFAWLIEYLIRHGTVNSYFGNDMPWGESIWNGFVWNFQLITAMVLLLVALVALLGATALSASMDDKSGKAVNIIQHSINFVILLGLAGYVMIWCIGCDDLFNAGRVLWWEGFWRTVNSIILFLALGGVFLTSFGSVAIYVFSLIKKIKA